MSEEDDFGMLLEDDDKAVLDLTTDLRHTGLGEAAENGVGSDKDRGAREWTREEMKLVEPCIELIQVCVCVHVCKYTCRSEIMAHSFILIQHAILKTLK